MKNIIEVCDIYQHFKGAEYRVIGVSLGADSDELIPRVEYRSIEGGPTYSRTQENFLEIVDRPEYNYRGPRFIFLRKDGQNAS